MKDLVKAGVGTGAFTGFVLACHDVSMQVGGHTLRALTQTTADVGWMVVVYVAAGAAIGLGSCAVLAVFRLVSQRRQTSGAAPVVAYIIVGGSTLAFASVYDFGEVAALVRFVSLSMIALGAWLLVRSDQLGLMAPGRLIAFLLCAAVGSAVLMGGARLLARPRLAGAWSLSGLQAYMVVVGASVAAACVVYGLARALHYLSSRKVGETRATYIVLAIIGLPALSLFAWRTAAWAAGRRGDTTVTSASREGETRGAKPNVILISIDTLRPDPLGYNGGDARTPVLDQIASESFVFENAFSVAPWTRPSFAAFFSGCYPSEMGVARIRGRDAEGAWAVPFQWSGGRPLLAEILRADGYATSATVTNPNLAPMSGADRGFDHFGHCDFTSAGFLFDVPWFDGVSILTGQLRQSNREIAELTSGRALTALSRVHSEPCLIWVHYNDPHAPYRAPDAPERDWADTKTLTRRRYPRSAAQRQKFLSAYLREIEYCDAWVGTVVEGLKEKGLWDKSIVVFWSDHGEEFWEHAQWEHCQSLYSELLHVPLLIKMPGQAQTRRVGEYVTLLDIMPTILQSCDVDLPGDLRGRSLGPVLNGSIDRLPPLRAYVEGCVHGSIRKGLLTAGRKLVYDTWTDSFELYDLDDDPGDQRNIYGTSLAPDTTEMERDLLKWCEASLAMMDEYSGKAARPVPPGVREQLRDLGYAK